jgi:alkylhydroperoxidase family enzyme
MACLHCMARTDMANPKKHASQDSGVGEEQAPQSRVRIKPQSADGGSARELLAAALRASSSSAIEQFIAEAKAGHYSREQIVDGVLAIKLAGARALLSEEELTEFAIQTRRLFLEDPRFR